MKRSVTLPCLCAALTFAVPVAAQTAGSGVAVSTTFESVSFSESAAGGPESVSLGSFLFSATGSIAGRARLDVSGGFARGAVDVDGTEATLSGLRDTRVTLSVPLLDDLITFSLIGVAPTGAQELDPEEAIVAGIVAADLLPFQLSSWGTGGGFGGSVAIARTTPSVGLAIGAGYLVGREFEAFATDEPGGSFGYRPGDALTISAAISGRSSRTARPTLVVAYENFGTDEFGGQNLFQTGDRLRATGSVAFATGRRSSGVVYAGVLHRQAASVLADGLVDPAIGSQDLLFFGAGLRARVGPGVLIPDAEARMFRREDGLDQGYHLALGIGYEVRTPRTVWTPRVRARLGNVDYTDTASSGFSGFDIGLSARFGGRTR